MRSEGSDEMSVSWKVSMPKAAAKPGHTHFVIASKTEKGSRAEMIAQFSEKKARLMWKLAQMTDAEIDKTLGLIDGTGGATK